MVGVPRLELRLSRFEVRAGRAHGGLRLGLEGNRRGRALALRLLREEVAAHGEGNEEEDEAEATGHRVVIGSGGPTLESNAQAAPPRLRGRVRGHDALPGAGAPPAPSRPCQGPPREPPPPPL